ncbi:MAG: M1 family metallopeptidase [Proteobacteria bacterium]|nr:M1 family metallopeptidase [Pseudomonadota bacterium]
MRFIRFIACLAAAPLAAQQVQTTPPRFDRTGVGDTSIFAPLPLGTPNGTRSASGAPGAHYWQNRADYDLKATLDTATKSIIGEMTLHYTNNSPDTLTFLWLQTEQNAFRPNSLNGYIFPQDSRFGARDFQGGYTFSRVEQVMPAAGKGAAAHGARKTLTMRDNETMTKVNLAEPLAPGHAATIEIAYRFAVPEHGADRMGRDGALYEIAQWYPRVAVYDEIRGWNIEPYLGQGEFYLDYGDYTLSLTVPAGYIVAATGALENAKEVLTPPEIARLAEAAKSDKVVRIITADELASGAARPKHDGTYTWKFHAKNVRDAVWAASPEYQWDASSYKGAYAFAFYRPKAAKLWQDAADMSRMSIQEYSERWFPYPWPHITAIEGPISGMEYPMIAMEDQSRTPQELYNVVTHEIGHMWFPMIVGSNERVYMWQDEGFNTFINTFSEARRFPADGDQMRRALGERAMIEGLMRANQDQPINVGPDRIEPNHLGFQAYIKPSVGLQLLRQEILGPEAFDEAFRAYTARWAYKHPTPADFFRTMEDVAGRRLDWFWREWFVENPHFDQAFDNVKVSMKGDTAVVDVIYANRARGVLPIRARFTMSDGTTQDFNYPAEVWSTNTVQYRRQYKFAGKKPVKIELDPEHRLVDIDRSNNVWNATQPVVP